MTYIEIGENSNGRSKALGKKLDNEVITPLDRAQIAWRDSSKNKLSYKKYKRCDDSASGVLQLSKTISAYQKSNERVEPEYDSHIQSIVTDLTECEGMLNIKQTF